MSKWVKRVLSAVLACLLISGVVPMIPPLTVNAAGVTVTARTFDAGWGVAAIMSNGNILASDNGKPSILNDDMWENEIVQWSGISDAIEVSYGPHLNDFNPSLRTCYVLRSNKTVWATGGDYSKDKFTQVASSIIRISGNYAINVNNELLELGDSKIIMKGVADVTRDGLYALKTDGFVYRTSDNAFIMNGVIQISGGKCDFTNALYALKSNGDLYVFGRSFFNHNNAGKTQQWQAGYDFHEPERIATSVSSFSSGGFGLLVQEKNNTMWHWDAWGNREVKKQINIGNDVASFSCADGYLGGHAFAVFVTSKGSLYTFDNTYTPVKLMDGIKVPLKEDNGANSIKKKTVEFRSKIANGDSDSIPHYTNIEIDWGWDLFNKTEKIEYDSRLSIAGLALSTAAEDHETPLYFMLRELGFDESTIKPYDYDTSPHQATRVAHTFAHKSVIFNGADYNIFVIVNRGSHDLSDWIATNPLSLIDGFSFATNRTANDFQDYVKIATGKTYKQVANENNKLFIVGHSLGGAVANNLSVYFEDFAVERDTFVYTYAAPQTRISVLNLGVLGKSNVFNIVNAEDPTPIVPPSRDAKIGAIMSFHRNRVPGMSSIFDLLSNGKKPSGATTIAHSPVTYMSYLLSSDTWKLEHTFRGTKLVKVKCPVNVEVYNSSGKSVGSITNNVTEYTDILIYVEGDEKYIYMPFDEDFTLKLTATDSGSMEFSVFEIDPQTGTESIDKTFKNIALYEGKQFSSSVSSSIDVSDVALYVDDAIGNHIAVVNQNGSESTYETKQYFKLWGKDTSWEKTPLNWFLLIACFGWIWMAF